MASFRQASADDSGVDAHPVEFVRVVASLIPRELEATATVTERASDDDNVRARSLRSNKERRRPPRLRPL
jgi:hypothetical protein